MEKYFQEQFRFSVEFQAHPNHQKIVSKPTPTAISTHIMKNLADWPPGAPALVTEVSSENSLERRLAEQGIHIGAVIEVLGTAPFRGPLLVRTKGSVVAVRRREAELVKVQESNP